jgi:hypothetical protein
VHFKSKEKKSRDDGIPTYPNWQFCWNHFHKRDFDRPGERNGGAPYVSLKYLTALNQNPIVHKVAAKTNASEKIMQENRDA